jgi:2-hydroxy-6-oxonona-2,4-dienedioate hydrolase
MRRLGLVLLAILGIVVIAGLIVWFVFDADMRAARGALEGRSQIIDTAAGPIEYADVGGGTPLLTIHGAGGGFDQGLDNAGSMVGPDFRLIAPSRFGYLRTPVPADTSPAAQAEAHVALLDELGIDRAVVLGVSAGTRSALELALRHPDRVSALILVVPATYFPDMVQLETEREAAFPLMLWLVNAGADFAWWALERVAPDMLISFVGVPPEVVHAAAPAEQQEVMRIVKSIEPLSERFAGINIDSAPELTPRPLGDLTVPTLLVTARDDLFNTYPSAEYTAGQVPGAKLVVFEEGGHLLVGHGEEVQAAVSEFLADTDLDL